MDKGMQQHLTAGQPEQAPSAAAAAAANTPEGLLPVHSADPRSLAGWVTGIAAPPP